NATHEQYGLTGDSARLLTRLACAKDRSATDGLIMVLPGKDADFRMDFYNPDGSYGALCGNGARCATQAAKDFGVIPNDQTRFEVLGVTNSAELLDDQLVRVRFQDPVDIKLGFKLRIGKNVFI